jgi:hypothetical protein
MLLDDTTCSSPNYKNLIIENTNNLDTNNYNHIVFIPSQTTTTNTADIAFTNNDNNINRTSSFRTPSYSINNQSSELNRLLKQKAATLILNQNQNKKSESFRIQNSSGSTNSSHLKDKKKKINNKNSKKKKDKFNFLTCSGENDAITTSSLSTTSASSNNSEESNSILQHLTSSYSTNQNNNQATLLLDQNNHYQKLFYPNLSNNNFNYQQNLITTAATLNRNQTAAFIYNPDTALLHAPKLIQIVNLDSIVNPKQPQFYECIQLVNLIDPNTMNYENNNLNLFNPVNNTNINNRNEGEQVYDTIEDIVSRNNSIPNLTNTTHFKPLVSPKLNNSNVNSTSQSYRTMSESFKKKYPKTNPNYSVRINNN